MKPTQEQVIAWAREVGAEMGAELWANGFNQGYEAGQESMKWDGIHSCHTDCQRPACVHTRKAVEAEREACAQMVEEWITHPHLATAIRARRQG